MKKIICENYSHLSMVAADLVAKQITAKPNSVLCLPTGTTAIGMYQDLIQRYNRRELNFKSVSCFCLEENHRLSRGSDKTYAYFLAENLFNNINIGIENIHIPNSDAHDPEAECAHYNDLIDAVGGIDMQILGVGTNGHIGGIQPAPSFIARTHCVHPEPDRNSFDLNMPTSVITMGIADILSAEQIVLLIHGQAKAEIAKRLFEYEISTSCPVSMLHLHRCTTVIMDKAAASTMET